jgi:hypothetical protein
MEEVGVNHALLDNTNLLAVIQVLLAHHVPRVHTVAQEVLRALDAAQGPISHLLGHQAVLNAMLDRILQPRVVVLVSLV